MRNGQSRPVGAAWQLPLQSQGWACQTVLLSPRPCRDVKRPRHGFHDRLLDSVKDGPALQSPGSVEIGWTSCAPAVNLPSGDSLACLRAKDFSITDTQWLRILF